MSSTNLPSPSVMETSSMTEEKDGNDRMTLVIGEDQQLVRDRLAKIWSGFRSLEDKHEEVKKERDQLKAQNASLGKKVESYEDLLLYRNMISENKDRKLEAMTAAKQRLEQDFLKSQKECEELRMEVNRLHEKELEKLKRVKGSPPHNGMRALEASPPPSPKIVNGGLQASMSPPCASTSKQAIMERSVGAKGDAGKPSDEDVDFLYEVIDLTESMDEEEEEEDDDEEI